MKREWPQFPRRGHRNYFYLKYFHRNGPIFYHRSVSDVYRQLASFPLPIAATCSYISAQSEAPSRAKMAAAKMKLVNPDINPAFDSCHQPAFAGVRTLCIRSILKRHNPKTGSSAAHELGSKSAVSRIPTNILSIAQATAGDAKFLSATEDPERRVGVITR